MRHERHDRGRARLLKVVGSESERAARVGLQGGGGGGRL